MDGLLSLFPTHVRVLRANHDARLHFVQAGYVIEPPRNVYVVTVT